MRMSCGIDEVECDPEIEPPLFHFTVNEKRGRFDGGESLGHGNDKYDLQHTYQRPERRIAAEKKELWQKEEMRQRRKSCGGGNNSDPMTFNKRVHVYIENEPIYDYVHVLTSTRVHRK